MDVGSLIMDMNGDCHLTAIEYKGYNDINITGYREDQYDRTGEG